MYWFPIHSQRHQCSLIVIEKDSPRFSLRHSENFPGYDKVKWLVDVSECPVCQEKYEFNKRNTKEVVEQITYKEFQEKK